MKDDSPNGHGTCGASKAAGILYGSAKASELVVVKMRGITTTEISQVFDLVLRDIQAHNLQNKAVVSCSFGSKEPVDLANLSNAWKSAKRQMQVLIQNNVVVVVSGGNIKAKAPG